MILDRHTLALVSIVGSSLDVLGTLYLAYDLFGGEHGPLRTLTPRRYLRSTVRSWVRPRPRACIWARERHSPRHHTRLGVFPRFEASTEAWILV
jgi:hypothetical protein